MGDRTLSANEIHVDDIGSLFSVTVKDDDVVVDVSSATTKNIIFKHSNGTTLTKPAIFGTDGTDGVLTYTSIAGDLSLPGIWAIQVELVMSGGSWKSDVGEFMVEPNL